MSENTAGASEDLAIGDLLNAQTGKLTWPELARHFARGVVICVAGEEDLLQVAEILIEDDASKVRELNDSGKLHRATDHDAIRWQAEETDFWAVVVAPWVVVQEVPESTA